MPLGVPELLIVLAIVLLLFGARRLPELGRHVGGGVRELRAAVARRDEQEPAEDETDASEVDEPPAHPRG